MATNYAVVAFPGAGAYPRFGKVLLQTPKQTDAVFFFRKHSLARSHEEPDAFGPGTIYKLVNLPNENFTGQVMMDSDGSVTPTNDLPRVPGQAPPTPLSRSLPNQPATPIRQTPPDEHTGVPRRG